MKAKIFILLVLMSLTVLGLTSVGYPQDKYPTKPIQIIVAFGPGGASDLFWRALTGELGKIVKEPVNVVNKPGSVGLLAADMVANSKNDGYTLLGTTTTTLTIIPAIDPKAVRDLDPIAFLANQPTALVTRTESELKTLADVVAYAKKKPGDLTCATSGVQGETYFNLEIFNRAAGINITHVSTSSISDGISNTLGGHVNFWWGSLSGVLSLAKGGRLRVLGFTGNRRLPEYPDFPTFAEQGFPQVNLNLIINLMGPKGLPHEVTDKWGNALKTVLQNPKVIASLKKLNFEIDVETEREKQYQYFKEQVARFSQIAKEAGIQK
jgi:tripartite-type tricarboxylate transporter receptor subunit TctC